MLPQGICSRRCIAVVVDAQATAEVNVVNGNACRFNVGHQIKNPVHGIQIRRGFCDLRANVAVDAHHNQAWQGSCTLVSLNRAFVCNAKFVAFEAGGNVGVRFRINVGVHAQTHRCFFVQRQSDIVEHVQFCFAFHVEASNADFKGLFHFCACFANTRKNDFLRCTTRCQNAGQFAARDNVKATAGFGEDLQHGQIGVGLHGVANLHFAACKATLVGRQCRQHGCFGISEDRRAKLGCNIGKLHVLHAQAIGLVSNVRLSRKGVGVHGFVAGGVWGVGVSL